MILRGIGYWRSPTCDFFYMNVPVRAYEVFQSFFLLDPPLYHAVGNHGIWLSAATYSGEIWLPATGGFCENHWLDFLLHFAAKRFYCHWKYSGKFLTLRCIIGESNSNSHNSLNLKSNLKKIKVWIRDLRGYFWWKTGNRKSRVTVFKKKCWQTSSTFNVRGKISRRWVL
jgi:hypothetical protein